MHVNKIILTNIFFGTSAHRTQVQAQREIRVCDDYNNWANITEASFLNLMHSSTITATDCNG